MALILKENGEAKYVDPANGSNFTLDELSEIVGGYIEIVECKADPQTKTNKGDHILVINEEGKFKEGHKNNVHASTLVDLMEGDYIAGTALFCASKEVE